VYRAITSLLKISQDLLWQWIVKIIRYDESAGSETKRPRPTDPFDRPNFRDRSIMLCHDQRLPFEDTMKDGFWVLLHFFDRNVHTKCKCNKTLLQGKQRS
jgi:hypothetical protein